MLQHDELEKVTLGEVYRLLRDVSAEVKAVKEQTTKTNGTVGRHDERLRTLETEHSATRDLVSKLFVSVVGVLAAAAIGGVGSLIAYLVKLSSSRGV